MIVRNKNSPNLTLFYLLVAGLILLNSYCAVIPEFDKGRVDRIARGPEFEPYTGIKKRIAVFDFENVSHLGGEKLGSGFSDMLITQLSRSGRFILLERSRLEQILQEQAIGQSGLISEESAAQVGQLLGVEAIITGKINQAGQQTGSHEFDKKDDWNLALKATVGFVDVSFRMISTTSGEILLANQVQKKEIKPGFGLQTKEVDFSNLYEFDQTVVGVAFRKAANQIASEIVQNIDKVKSYGKVVQTTQDSVVYFTPGSGAGVRVGQIFNVYSATSSLADDSFSASHSISSPQRPKARIEVSGFIGDKVSRARVLMGGGIKRGDLVELLKNRQLLTPQ